MSLRFEVIRGGSASAVRIYLQRGDTIKAESDALVSKSDSVEIDASMDGGVFGGLARSFLTDESFFFQVLRCAHSGNVQGPSNINYVGEALLAPADQGDITVLNLDPAANPHGNGLGGAAVQAVRVARGAFLCCASSVEVDTRMPTNISSAGNAMLSGTGFFIMKCSGRGPLALACLGSCIRYDLGPGERRQVDNGHLVAWGDSVPYQIGMATRSNSIVGSIFGSMASGEGLMCTFTGPGPVWIQTHKESEPHSGAQKQRGSGSGPFGKIVGCCVMAFFLCIFGGVVAYVGYLSLFGDGSWQQDGDGSYSWVSNELPRPEGRRSLPSGRSGSRKRRGSEF